MKKLFLFAALLIACSGCTFNYGGPKPTVNANILKTSIVNDHTTITTVEHDGVAYVLVEHDKLGSVAAFSDVGRKQRMGAAPLLGSAAPSDVEEAK